MKIALASPAFPGSIDAALTQLEILTRDAAGQGAQIICFPETYIPGYPANGYEVQQASQTALEEALQRAAVIAGANAIAMILPMDWHVGGGFYNVAFVIAKTGEVLGYQTKNQLDPSEDDIWDAGTERKVFEVDGLKFGITICHEGFRYPESVRWAAKNGAAIVFHPQFTGNDFGSTRLSEWGHKDNPYYEKAMQMRAVENIIYFASINYATKFQDSATSLIAPDGDCIAYQHYGETGVIVADIDPLLATGKLAKRFKEELYYKGKRI